MPRPPGRSVDGHVARKRFGQNFLADPHYLARIADAVAPRPGDIVVEIGPGLGALTAELIARAGRVIAIDRDPSRLALASVFGATHTLDAGQGDPIDAVKASSP